MVDRHRGIGKADRVQAADTQHSLPALAVIPERRNSGAGLIAITTCQKVDMVL